MNLIQFVKRNTITTVGLCLLMIVFAQAALAQGISISSVTPSSASAGDTVSVTIVLSGDQLPPKVSAATIGTISGTSVSYASPNVTATFAIPSDQSTGSLDVTVTFPTPNGDINIAKTDGFTVLSSAGVFSPVYVNAASTATSPDGSSWGSAFASLQDGIDAAALYYAANGTDGEVWVAAGAYYPTTDSDRTVYFELKSGVAVYGGFAGNETERTARNYSTNLTILSGDIGTTGNSADNSYHVLVGTDGATLDGFTITGGHAEGHTDVDSDDSLRWHRLGGGLYFEGSDSTSPATMTISNCTFSDNYARSGGAMYLYFYANPIISNCAFSDNSAENGGAILARVGSDAVIENSSFSSNYAEWRGGGIYVGYGANPAISNTTFTGNSTDGNGGAFYADDRSSQLGTTKPTLSNCSFTGNSAVYRGGAISNYNNATYTCVTDSSFSNNTAGSGGGAIACESDPVVTLVGSNTFSGNSGGTGNADADDDNGGCTINTAGTTCP